MPCGGVRGIRTEHVKARKSCAGGGNHSRRRGKLRRQAAGDGVVILDAAFLDAGTTIRTSDTDGVHFEPGEHAKLGKAVAGIIRTMAA